MKQTLLEETFELVKSLSRTEKRYFKLFTQFQQGDKTYINLFDIIDKHLQYDEEKISRKFLANNQVTNFPGIKRYLFDQLVASIKSYGAYKDLDSDHTDLIETYKVLHYKGLYGQSERLLKKVKKLTWEDDAFTRHFSVLLMEYQRELFDPNTTSPDNVIRILKERRQTLDIIDNYLRIGETFTLIRLHLRKKLYCRDKKDKDELTRIAAPLLKTKESDMLSRTALGMRNIGLCDYFLAIGQPKKAFETSRIYLELRKNAGSNDKLDVQTLNEYLQHIVISIRSGIYDNLESNIQEYKSMIDSIKNQDKYRMMYERWLNLTFIFYNRSGQFEYAASFLEKERRKNANPEKHFSMKAKMTLWYFMAYNQFALKDYKTALKSTQKIINNADNDVEELSFAKLLVMFIHYELKNYELLEYQVRSAERMMKKTERLYKCEKLLFDFFKNAASVTSNSMKRQELSNLQQKLILLFRSPFEKSFTYYFDVDRWIEENRKRYN